MSVGIEKIESLGGGGRLVLPIHNVTPFTMLDYPDHLACIIWFSGCNMRCGYCHNPDLIAAKGKFSLEQVKVFLTKRANQLEAVVLSGGEASLYPDLVPFARFVKSLGYKVKLDTNGSRPDRLKTLIDQGLVDYVALDYKAPADKYPSVCDFTDFHLFSKSLDLLCQQEKASFEVRTTVHTDLLNEEDIICMMRDLENRGYQHPYYIQNFRCLEKQKILTDLPEQKRCLDINMLQEYSVSFPLEFRNF